MIWHFFYRPNLSYNLFGAPRNMAWRHMHGALGFRNGEAMVLGYLDNVLTVLGCSSEAEARVEGRCFDP